jgi:hypothetical protein
LYTVVTRNSDRPTPDPAITAITDIILLGTFGEKIRNLLHHGQMGLSLVAGGRNDEIDLESFVGV